MKTKKNIVALIIFCVLALSIIGLSIGIILVAQQATVMNSMSIRYEATNVDCTVVSSAKLYNNSSDTVGTDVKIQNSEDTTFTTTFTSSDPGT
ncbi:MAG: hypothetical protein E7361_04740, partial [Clostridiales bacterium]|nr:hypothetical protein [Clostridiales bacterium]